MHIKKLFFILGTSLLVFGCSKDQVEVLNDDTVISIPDKEFSMFCAKGSSTEQYGFRGGYDLVANGGNGDGKIQYAEVKNIKEINIEHTVYETTIKNFKGIEYFADLKYLYSDNNKSLTNVDVSKCSNLVIMRFRGNSALKELSLGKQEYLKGLYCENTAIISLDISRSSALTRLNLSGCTALKTLTVWVGFNKTWASVWDHFNACFYKENLSPQIVYK